MTAVNHALTGATLAFLIGNPYVALPVALVSHFICDSLPHYGDVREANSAVGSRRFTNILLLDIALCGLLVIALATIRPEHWWLAAVCAFLATLPDAAWLPAYIRVKRGGPFLNKPNRYVRFSIWIQWFQRPIGAVVELAWFVAGSAIVAAYLS